MTTLAVTRSLTSNTNPTESQFDTMRSDLLTFFNSTGLAANNIAAGGMLYTSLNAAFADDVTMKWTSDDAILKYDSSGDKFVIQNTEGSIFFGLKVSSTITRYLELDEAGLLSVYGVPTFNTSVGSQAMNLPWLLSRYRKPRLVYSTDDIVTLMANGPDGTYVMGRDRLWKVIDTTCSLAATANGYEADDTGAAVSGLEIGLTRTANRWYYIYAVEVQYGDDANGINCILSASVTSPLSANITTLNTEYGTGKWLYMGVIRNGYNDGVNTNIILPFVVEENGYTMFTQATSTIGGEGRGMTLATSSGTNNLEYTLDIVNNDADSIPPTATRAMVSGYRSTHGFEFHYREIASDENHAVTSSCYHPANTPSLTGIVHLEVPVLTGYKLVVVMGNTDSVKRICLVGYMDHYL